MGIERGTNFGRGFGLGRLPSLEAWERVVLSAARLLFGHIGCELIAQDAL
jgi:hypothetical protein